MERPRIAGLLLLAALQPWGCQWTANPDLGAQPPLVTNASPNPGTLLSYDLPLPEETLKQPAPPAASPKPSLHPPRPKGAKSTNPNQSARRDPTSPPRRPPPARAQAQPEPPSRQAPPPARPSPPPARRPNFELPQPDYPTAQARAVPSSQAYTNAAAPQLLAGANGLGARGGPDNSELFLVDEEEAYPVYHPSVEMDGWRDELWLTAQFDVSPNGSFRVAMVEGTGDPVLDSHALAVLRQWKWKPKTVRRRPVFSSVLIRLNRKVSPR